MDTPTADAETASATPERTSKILARLATESERGNVTIGAIVDALYDRSFGVVIILFALPNTSFPSPGSSERPSCFSPFKWPSAGRSPGCLSS